MKLKIVSLIVLVIFLTLTGLFFLKGDVKEVPQAIKQIVTPQKNLEVYAWYPDYDEDNALASLKKAKISEVSPFWYMLDTSGHLVSDESETKSEAQVVSKNRDIEVLPSIVNDFDGKRVHLLLQNKASWNDFSEKLVTLAKREGYKGFDLDLEELLATDRNTYTEFVAYLSSVLHKHALLLSITVHAQTGDPDPRDAVIAQDLAGLSKSADQIRVMAYDFHHSESDAGPVTPLSDLQKVLDETKKLVPHEKAVIALPTYGYDWSPTHGSDLQYADAMTLILKNNISYHLVTSEQALTGTYQDSDGKHTIWFENSQTLKAKVDMVQKAGFYKISLWRLGGEDPLTWDVLK